MVPTAPTKVATSLLRPDESRILVRPALTKVADSRSFVPAQHAGRYRRHVRPDRRARLVDAAFVVLALGWGLVVSVQRVELGPHPPAWLFTVDQVTGVLGSAALLARRRHPVALVLVLATLSTYSETVAGAVLGALFTVAVHRPARTTVGCLVAASAAGVVFVVLRPEPGAPGWLLVALGVALYLAAAGWGMVVRHRRQLADAERDRVQRLVAHERARAEAAHRDARDAIAREIHDLLGHRLSLLALHAGALEYRLDATPEEVRRAAGILREAAHQAMQDLRDVVGVLRAPDDDRPMPEIDDVPELVGEAAAAGTVVGLTDEAARPVPERLGRTAYRVVQEALTNVRKHAPSSAVAVRLSGRPGDGLTITVSDQAARGATDTLTPPHDPRPDPAGGAGLIGLTERVAVVGGALRYGRTDDGWEVRAWLPWEA